MKKNLTKVVCALMASAMVLSMAGCGGSSDSASTSGGSSSSGGTSAATGDTIRFAVMSPMTGENAATGEQLANGVAIAVDEINAAGGVNGKQLEYEVFDDQANTNQAVICGEKIASDGGFAFAIASNSSGCSQAAYPALANAGIPLISGVNTADFMTNQGFTMYLRICVKDSAQTEQLVQAVIDAGYKAPAIFYSTAETDTTNAQLAQEDFKAAGIDVVGTAQIQPDTEKDYNAHITNFRGAGADVVVFCCEYNPAALFLKQAATLGWTDFGAYGTAGTSNPQLIEIAGADAAEGYISIASYVADIDAASDRSKAFIEAYQAKANTDPGEWAAGAYDSVYIMADVLGKDEAASLSGQELVDWIKANETYEGIMVDVDFDENGDNTAASVVQMVVKDGAWKALQ